GVGRAAVGLRHAVRRQRVLADAVVAVAARGHALRDLRARRALGRIVEVLGRAGGGQPDRRRRAGDDAAAEAVAAVRHQLLALVDAALRLRRRQRALRRVLLRVL